MFEGAMAFDGDEQWQQAMGDEVELLQANQTGVLEGLPAYARAIAGIGGDEQWRQALDDEVELLQANQTWVLEGLPAYALAIAAKWVYHIKIDGDRRFARLKAWLVAKGYVQREGDFVGSGAAAVIWASYGLLDTKRRAYRSKLQSR